MSDEQKLTEGEREKIQRLLESGTLENVTLALSLIEETAGQDDIAEIFTMNVIAELICLNGPESLEAMVMAGQFIRRCPETWKRFSEAVVGPDVLTLQKYQVISTSTDKIIEIAWPVWSACPDLRETDEMLTADYSQFTLISAAAAGVIASSDDCDDLILDGLTEVSDAAAAHLGQHQGILDLNGLTEISIAQAESLSKHEGESLDLGGLLKLSDAAAEILSKYKGSLGLRGLTEISDAAAESLSKHEGESLGLRGLTKLADAAAVQLGSHNNLHTSTKIKRQIRKAISTRNEQVRNSTKTGQTALTKKQAVKLRKLFRSKDADNVLIAVKLIDASEATLDDIIDVLSFSVLSLLVNTWDIGVWNALAPLLLSYPDAKREFTELANKRIYQQSKYGFIEDFYRDVTKPLALLDLRINPGELNGLTSLSDAAAECLTKHDGRLHLNGLTSISDAAVVILSKHKCDLYLDGLTDLSDAAAESLTKHEGRLYLRGLTSLSDAAAESLSKYEGYLDLWLTSLSDAVAESLSKYEGDLDLSGLTKISDAAAKSLGKHKGNLDLWGLTSLSDVAVEALSSHEGGLKLGLTELSVAAAASLGKLRRNLNLDGLTELSVAAATSLGQHKYGHLNLWDLTSLSDAAAEGLAIRKRKLTDSHIRLSELPESAAKILRDAGHG